LKDLLQAVKAITTPQLVQQVDTVYKFVLPDHAVSVYYLDLKNGKSPVVNIVSYSCSAVVFAAAIVIGQLVFNISSPSAF